ncbi:MULTISPECIES: D-alanyl-D-alanine endopeptidase [Marinobacter]|jgi:D-alanyl-D-alanine endopeptidase (penicillin-binding protein 7)|uniref:D-alanyl-D-alanine endopeptidase n=1 Tax=Marinobacter TaxID=2742 RepID=UPI000A71C0E3|nr:MULTISPECIES: D-alanyl-D-alanine endopeptidase [Marinobacter]AZR41547.1 D-alanyl-D-alanine endopeptidase [Marinobacter salarius]MAB51076.1 D-alanyl-D-alanine endopeptidase [Marinobacter sp.]MBJ7276707.1 D-alanyl-D-alanine endopeptidase [Marinobacter salarius]MBJ7299426.1 D-alanyl-D-alanine endopeptidase [Marinobacter salarius]MCC4283416.1 D-alanyl-D-alanine endopeptidase [Marinobacter salarius]|tara:strand:+ start:1536 stop:2450 length:915 start_codon:yes stop_codon:yes gene_type:complete
MIRTAIVLALTVLCLLNVSRAMAIERSELQLASVNAAVAYADDEGLVYGKNADRRVPIASITKLMTALVVMESGEPLTEWLDFRERHIPAPANAYTRIRVSSELRRSDVLRIALMSSENFAAHTLARHHPGGYDAFIEAMNAKAVELGMLKTTFVDPTGLSVDNRSTAADLVRLVRAASQYPQIREYSTTRYFTAQFRQPRYRLAFGNTNVLVHRDSWGVGISKTGYLSEAGRCLVMLFELDGKPLVTVLLDSLGTRSPMGDAGRIKRWLTTGAGGSVAAAARAYERKKNAAYAASDGASVSVN